jgi:hypothetical protein
MFVGYEEERMRKTLVAFGIMLVLTLITVGVASAITNGEPDDGRHPYVALLVFGEDAGDGFVPYWRCSGALISPDVILTAGHCTDGATDARIWFGEGPIDWGTWDPATNPTCNGETGYPCTGDAEGAPYTNPDFCIGCGNGLPGFAYRDVGVVELDGSFDMYGFAELPEADLVDSLKNKEDVDLVGYGVQYQAQIPGKYVPKPPPYNRWAGLRQRMYAPSELVSGNFVHSDEFMRLSMNPGGGKGGSCFGDSGGPDLLGGTDTVLAVNSYVTNFNCAGVGYSQRVDIPDVLEWIGSHLE